MLFIYQNLDFLFLQSHALPVYGTIVCNEPHTPLPISLVHLSTLLIFGTKTFALSVYIKPMCFGFIACSLGLKAQVELLTIQFLFTSNSLE